MTLKIKKNTRKMHSQSLCPVTKLQELFLSFLFESNRLVGLFKIKKSYDLCLMIFITNLTCDIDINICYN